MGNILTELLPRKVRLVLYVIVFLALLVLAAWQANEGDILEFLLAVLGSLTSLLAAGNVNPPAVEPVPIDPGADEKPGDVFPPQTLRQQHPPRDTYFE